MALIKPAILRQGDTIGIVGPLSGGAGAHPHRVENGVKYLESLGFKVKMRSILVWVLARNTPASRFNEVLGGKYLREQDVEIG